MSEVLMSGDVAWWQRLPDVPEPTVSLAGVRTYQGDKTLVFVNAQGGKVYAYECCQPNVPPQWVEVVATSRYARLLADAPMPTDACFGHHVLMNLRQPIFQCTYVALSMEWVAHNVYYALLADGSVWRWEYYAGFDMTLKFLGVGLVLGAVGGGLVAWWRQRYKIGR